MNTSSLSALFPDLDFGFRLNLKPGGVREFFAPSDDVSEVLGERQRWLESSESEFVVDEPANAQAWQEAATAIGIEAGSPRTIGERCEADLVLLRRDEAGVFRVRGGVVVFPTKWSLPEKVGLTLAESHGVVPGLNAKIGPVIDRYLDRLQPGVAAVRSNWGLAATDELNLHPSLSRPRLEAQTPIGQVWLRVERQLLTALPSEAAVLFGIRIELYPLVAVLADNDAKAGLHRALRSMPPEVATYKAINDVLQQLIRWSEPDAQRDSPS